MKLLDRHIAKTILAAIAVVTLMLAGLEMFILFVNQLDDLGKGDYGILQATMFVLLQLPYQIYLFFPMGCLLGSLTGLGVLANHRELIVMRAAGMSIGQITFAVIKVAIVLILLITLMGEFLVPKLSHMANDRKMQAVSQGQMVRSANWIWLRYHNDFISIGSILPNNVMTVVCQFSFDKNHRMHRARLIGHIVYEQGQWHAYDVVETVISDKTTQARKVSEMLWDVNIKPSVISVMGSEPDEMSLSALRQYLKVLERSHRAGQSYEYIYWQRMIQPLSSLVMMLLAIPFIFGPLRSSPMGSKILVGATAGFGFHLINRFFGPISQVFQWPPLMSALCPTLVFALIGLYLMRRVR